MDREGSGTPTCALNSMLIGMYKGNVLVFIHPDIFVHWRAFGFVRTPCLSRKSTQVFVHENPGHPRYKTCNQVVKRAFDYL